MLGAKARTPAWVSSLCQSRSLLPLQPAWKPAIAAINQTPEVHSMAYCLPQDPDDWLPQV